jgi:hypothetical protein
MYEYICTVQQYKDSFQSTDSSNFIVRKNQQTPFVVLIACYHVMMSTT